MMGSEHLVESMVESGKDVEELKQEIFWWRFLSLILGLAWVAFAMLWWIV